MEEKEGFLVLVVSSEKTWGNIFKWKLAENLKGNRGEFALAVTMNGYSCEGVSAIKEFEPDYFFLRPNLGFDAASISYSINILPLYRRTIILHDDHWFDEKNWFKKIQRLISENPDVDVWGNVLYGEKRPLFDEYAAELGLETLAEVKSTKFLHGMSGVFDKKVIRKFKEINLPYKNSAEKEDANLGERLFSAILFSEGFEFRDFPEGKYSFLMHNERNETNSLISTANEYLFLGKYEEAKELFYKYWEEIKKINFFDDLGLLFYHLSIVHYALNEKEKARLFYLNAKKIIPGVPLPIGMKDLFEEDSNR